jgi:P27 family predicted phage terminase small subunit
MGTNRGGGRRPTPAPLRLLKNDKAHAHRYVGRDEPVPSDSRAVAPESLSPRAKELFEDFVQRVEEMYPCSQTDLYSIVLYANNHEQLEYLENYLRENGLTYEEVKFVKTGKDTGVETFAIKTRPEAMIHKQCKDFELKILTEYGLTPSSRARVPQKPKAAVSNKFADLDETG